MKIKRILARGILAVFFATLLLPTTYFVAHGAVSDHYDVVVTSLTYEDASQIDLWWVAMSGAFERAGTIDVEVSDDGTVSFTVPPDEWSTFEADDSKYTVSFKGATFSGRMNRTMTEGVLNVSAVDGSFIEFRYSGDNIQRGDFYGVSGTMEIESAGSGKWSMSSNISYNQEATGVFYKDGQISYEGYLSASYTIVSAAEAASASTEDVLVYVVAGGIAVVGLGGGITVIRLLRKKAKSPQVKQQGTTSSAPEVYDWQGKRIDENARVQQTHEEYTQANRDAWAEREAREAAEAAEQKFQDEMLEELMRLGQRLRTTNRSAAGVLDKITRKQIDAALSGKALDPNKVNEIREAFGEFAQGKIIGLDDVPPTPTDSQLLARAYEDAFEEVCRNQTTAAVLVRSGSNVLSGGTSEYFFNAGKAVYRMRDYVEAGGDSWVAGGVEALYGAAEDYLVGKTADKFMKGGQKYIKGKLSKMPKVQKLKNEINWQLRVATNDGYYVHSVFPTETKLMDATQRFLQRETAMAQRATTKIAKDQVKRATKAVVKKTASPVSKAAQKGLRAVTR